MPIDPPIDPSDLKRFHNWCGLGLHSAQQLEYGVKYLLWLLADRGIIQYDAERATDLMEGRAKLTLGQVMKVLAQHVTISDDVAETFRKALENRNRFIHELIVEHNELLADPSARESVIDEIKAIRRSMLAGDEVVRVGIAQLLALYGVNFNEFQEQLVEEIRAKNTFDAEF